VAVPRSVAALLCSHLAFAVAPVFAPGYFPKVAPHDLVTWAGRAEWLFDWLVWPPFFVSGVLTWAIVMPGFVGSFWWLRRLSTSRVAVWGVLVGVWAAMLVFRSPLVVTADVLESVGLGRGLAELVVRGALHLLVVPNLLALLVGLGRQRRW
jgi:hypothetical protein